MHRVCNARRLYLICTYATRIVNNNTAIRRTNATYKCLHVYHRMDFWVYTVERKLFYTAIIFCAIAVVADPRKSRGDVHVNAQWEKGARTQFVSDDASLCQID